MEIEILTTKKKLSASIIKQLPILKYKSFGNIKPIGGLRNVLIKDSYFILCQDLSDNTYFLMHTTYYILNNREEHLNKVYCGNAVGYSFDNQQKRDEWYSEYKKIIKDTPQLFI
jgi:hypothetical protein